MKALSLTEPWASLVVTGEKKIETRSWKPKKETLWEIEKSGGLIAIQASKDFPSRPTKKYPFPPQKLLGTEFFNVLEKHGLCSPEDFTLGAIIGVVELKRCLSTNGHALHFSSTQIEVTNNEITNWESSTIDYRKPSPETPEYAFGNYSPDRYMWFLGNVQKLATPIECRGALNLWDVPSEIEKEIYIQLRNTNAVITG